MLPASARAAVLTVEFSPVSYAEILECVLAYSIWKRTAATQAGQLPVARRRRLNADDFILCLAGRAAEDVDRRVWHERGKLPQGTSGPGVLHDTRATRRSPAGIGIRKDRGPRLAPISNDGLAIARQQFGLLGHEKDLRFAELAPDW
jgi:hypothetical protein